VRVAFLCDFDGTIAPGDIGAELVQRFSARPDPRLPVLLDAWRAGRIGHRALTEAECEPMRVTEPEALDFIRSFSLDPAFAPFVREAVARGDRVVVVSEGFGFYIRDRLGGAGLGGLPLAANELRFEPDGRVRLEFPFADPECGNCGNCKARHVRRQQADGYRTVLVGDGLSDRCGARAADVVFARAALLQWCRNEGLPARAFDRFADVAAAARNGVIATSD